MIDMQEIDGIEEWLIGQALSTVSLPAIFDEMCQRLRQCHVPVDRATVGWTTLHPLVEAEMVYWSAQKGAEHHRYGHHEEDEEEWLQSPMRAVLYNNEGMLRRKLQETNQTLDFPLLRSLASEGYSDYIVISTPFELPALQEMQGRTGILVSWSTRSESGFSDDALHAISYLQKRFALAARATLQAEITQTIADTYLGHIASRKVLTGQIRHGDGETIKAVIFYCDMRNSTAIAESLGPRDYISWLNTYFTATAGAILKHGGEILDFIGDAVLAVFPIHNTGLEDAARKAIEATDDVRRNLAEVNHSGKHQTQLCAGMALSVGEVMFGNIGVPDSLTFSVIGQTVHAAARMEALTKNHRDRHSHHERYRRHCRQQSVIGRKLRAVRLLN
ncbi:adenylyl cyclase class-3/4/guanylyl cyclase [Roseibium sp. TrichSKD4]|uniref:adenylate/guanylate cyclase domain-containing protein n=1 Tax=Roseibium sp. TrichSKD4 TaxID=744980 RepID=UPI0001E56569|nr:adenylate/guanylate cyclase domain-containing protein [Roseibium sp. TrichSKD4]EFO33497.1 adenylyl cyclase class-3/4/guanylyl cyclase [Roseibium sp. TrichSKD4]